MVFWQVFCRESAQRGYNNRLTTPVARAHDYGIDVICARPEKSATGLFHVKRKGNIMAKKPVKKPGGGRIFSRP
jgi:hypothetical protein